MALDNQDWSKAASGGGASYGGTIPIGQRSAPLPVGGAQVFFVTLAGSNGVFVSGSVDGVSWQSLDAIRSFPTPAAYLPAGLNWGSVFALVPCAGYTFVRVDNSGSAFACVFTATAVFGTPLLPLLGQRAMANSHPMVAPSDQPLGRAGQQTMANSLPVTMASDQPVLAAALDYALFNTDALLSASFAVALGAGANLVLVAAVAGQKVYCVQLNLAVITAAAALVQLQDTSGTVLGDIRTDAIMHQPHVLRGLASVTGTGIRLLNTAGIGAGTLAGELLYVQK